MKALKLLGLSCMLLIMMACEETTSYNGESLDGVWEVTELKPEVPFAQGYLCTVKHDENNRAFIQISNFLDRYEDHEVTDPNYILNASISGSRINVSSQGIEDVLITIGNGYIYNSNNFKIDYTYNYEGRTGTGSADFVRKN